MKLLLRVTIFILLTGIQFPVVISGQSDGTAYRLKEKIRILQQQPDYLRDTVYANAVNEFANLYSSTNPDTALLILKGHAELSHASGYKKGEAKTYMIMGDAFLTKGIYSEAKENYEKALELAKNSDYANAVPFIRNRIGVIEMNQGNYPDALSKFYESLKAADSLHNDALKGATLNNIAIVHFYDGQFTEAEKDYMQRLDIAKHMNDSTGMSIAYNGLGKVKLQQKKLTEALQYLEMAYNLASGINNPSILLTVTLTAAEAYYESDSLQKSVLLFDDGLRLARQMDNGILICESLIGLAKTRYRQGLLKEALANGLEGWQRAGQIGQVQLMRDANEIVATIYEALHDGNNALKYYRMYKLYSDSMSNLASQRAIAREKAGYEFSKKESAFQRKALQQGWLTFSAFAGLLLLAVILWIIMRNRNRLKHTYQELQHKNTEIEIQKSKAEEALFQLQATQVQLIQSEKMASLGELTAGIAHEIQNPLNFVNNFSEVNIELIAEMREEIEKANYDEVNALAKDIAGNEEKINHHGKRADAIVKGMLQHSRSSNGKKESTDINALADEYLRLSYHGLRAKDKSFNADFKTNFDETIGKIEVVPQDIGRVLLNLFTNAFYSVNKKKKSGLPEDYKPEVTVSTKQENNYIIITVLDNGSGIPQAVLDKIYQPFFTTKPTGEGTGLGLSMSYDIITKAHHGNIKATSEEGKFAEFVITLPVR